MPTVLRWNGHRFFFYSREPNEPPHVLVTRAGAQAKIWLSDCSVARSAGYAEHELNELRRRIREEKVMLLGAWQAYFGRP